MVYNREYYFCVVSFFMFWKSKMLNKSQEERLVTAITNAEQGSRGEVRVHLERKCPEEDPLARAEQVFFELGMQNTKEGTAALLYISIDSKKAAIFAGPGLYQSREQDFWQDSIELVVAGFRNNTPIQGIENALGKIGDLFREIVPGEDEAGNQLPNQVSTS